MSSNALLYVVMACILAGVVGFAPSTPVSARSLTKLRMLNLPNFSFGPSEEETAPAQPAPVETQDFTFEPTPAGMIAQAKVLLAVDLGLQKEALLDESFVWVAPNLGSKVLSKQEYIAAAKFFNLRSTFPDMDYRAHDFRIDSQDPYTVRLTARTVGTMRGKLRLRNQIVAPNGRGMSCPPEAISMTFDPYTGKLIKLCSGFTLDRLVGNTNGLCGVMAAATIAGVPPSETEIYPLLNVVGRFFGRPVKQLPDPQSFLAPFPETVMVQLAKGILGSDMAALDPDLLAPEFTYCGSYVGPVGKRTYLEQLASQMFDGSEPEFTYFRVDPYDPYRVWVDVRPMGETLSGTGFICSPQALSMTFDDSGFCTRITGDGVMDPSIGDGGGLGGMEGIQYALGSPSIGLATRPLPQVLSRLSQRIFYPITNVGVDEYRLPGTEPIVVENVLDEELEGDVEYEEDVDMDSMLEDDVAMSASATRAVTDAIKRANDSRRQQQAELAKANAEAVAATRRAKAEAFETERKARAIAAATARKKAQEDAQALLAERKRVSEENARMRAEAEAARKRKADEVVAARQAALKEAQAVAEERKRVREENMKKKADAEAERKRKAEEAKAARAEAMAAAKEEQKRKAEEAAAAALARSEAAAEKKRQLEEARAKAAEERASKAEKARAEAEERKKRQVGQARATATKTAASPGTPSFSFFGTLTGENATSKVEASNPQQSQGARQTKPLFQMPKSNAPEQPSTTGTRLIEKPKQSNPFQFGMQSKPAAKTPKAKKGTTKKAKVAAKKAPKPQVKTRVGLAKPKKAPRGVPTVSKWRKNRDGSITGFITGSATFDENEKITTSTIVKGDFSKGSVVQTQSGSKYFLS